MKSRPWDYRWAKLKAMAPKLERLIGDFRWDRLDVIVESERARVA